MSKIFLYGLSLILLFNNAYTHNTMQYIPNNKQQFFNQNQVKHVQQKTNEINRMPQDIGIQHGPTNPIKQQQVFIDNKSQYNVNTQHVFMEQNSQQNNNKKKENNSNNTKIHNNLTNEDKTILLLNKINKKIDELQNEIKKTNNKVEQQQKENDKLVQQALNDFYNSQARTLIKPDGSGQIITESDIDPNKLSQYSQEKYPQNNSTMGQNNIISPS